MLCWKITTLSLKLWRTKGFLRTCSGHSQQTTTVRHQFCCDIWWYLVFAQDVAVYFFVIEGIMMSFRL